MTISLDPLLLLGAYQSRIAFGSGAASGAPKARVAPTAPWNAAGSPDEANAAVNSALAGRKLINESAAQLDLAGASADYRKLFALYQGLSTLMGLAERISAKGLASLDKARIGSAFGRGLAEIAAYVGQAQFDKLRLVQGEVAASAKSQLTVAKARSEYLTKPLASSTSEAVSAFQGDVKFTITVKGISSTSNVAIDLAGMGGETRTIGAVVSYINDQLTAAGVETRLATQRIPGQPRTVQVGGKTVTLPPSSDQWALKVKPGSLETVSFSAPATAGAVYLAQSVGDPDPDHNAATNDGRTQSQLLKFQTDTTNVTGPPQGAGQSYWVDGRVFSQAMGPEVASVHATAVGPDGSVYVLADVTAKTAGQEIKGTQDVALLKYDSAGRLLYTRTLGAGGSATGLALAVSADGKVAVAGALTGALNGAIDGPLNSGSTASFADEADSFVTLYDAEGQELWTERRGARLADEASHVAFGADGAVYVAGRSRSALPGATSIGGWDGYVEAFRQDADGQVQTLFAQSFGTNGSDRAAGLVVDGTSLVTASVEDGRAVLRRFDLSGGTPVLVASRDLGDLQGGDIAGLAIDGGQIVLAGTTTNAALSAGSITRAHAGGSDAFAARLSADLVAGAGDSLAYYGGAGDDRATSLAVAGGQVWIGGSAGADLPGQPPMGVKDGFLARLDVAGGTIDWSRRFAGKDGRAAPTAIAFDPDGASVLDRLGLPAGMLGLSDSQRITAQSAIRPGDQFTVKVAGGRAVAVTIEAADTLDTLAQKIRRASRFQAKVTIGLADGARYLKIEPANARQVVEIGAGKMDRDALAMLGIPEGVVRATTTADGKTLPADGKAMLYGLGLSSDLNLSDKDQIAHALAEVAAAMGVVRTIYKDLVAAASPGNALGAAALAGRAPAYLTSQLANYQAALDRLGG